MTRRKEPARRQVQYPGVFPYQTQTRGTLYRYAFDAPRKPDGTRDPRTRRGFLTEQDAWEAMQAEKRRVHLHGDLPDETLDEYFARWMRDTQASRTPNTNRSYALCWKRLPPPFRRLKLDAVTPTHIRSLYGDLVGRYAAATARETRNVVAMILRAAHRERLIPYNPADGVRMKISRDAQAEAAFDPAKAWTLEEQRRFLEQTADNPDHTLWRFLLDSGLRIGEALPLTWDDVDLDARIVQVRRSMTVDEHGRRIIGKQPKTPSSRREVDLQEETIEYLRRHLTAQKVRRVACGPLWQDRNLVFDDGDGTLVMADTMLLRFKRAVKKIDGVRPQTLHGLRHTMAVTWLKAGIDPVRVSKRLGHTDVAFTLNVYAKVSREWQRSAVDQVADYLKSEGKPLPPPEPEGTLLQWPEQG